MIVFDLDNTLRRIEGDQHHTPFALGLDPTDTRNWLQWQQYANDIGVPIPHMVQFYRRMKIRNEVIIYTSSQHGTEKWLRRNKVALPDTIIERTEGNELSGLAYKIDMINHWFDTGKLTLWVDDCTETCDYVESLGVPVVRVKA